MEGGQIIYECSATYEKKKRGRLNQKHRTDWGATEVAP